MNRKHVIAALLLSTGAYAQSTPEVVATGNLSMQRMGHTATLLENGSVLVAGGFAVLAGWPVWASAELYEPASGAFRRVGDMATPRAQHTATRLPDGKVLITGGEPLIDFSTGRNEPFLATAEVYDPSTQTLTRAGDMNIPRSRHSAVLLRSGKVLIVGGTKGLHEASAELYDPSTGVFIETGTPSVKAIAPSVTVLLSNGHVLLASAGDDLVARAELYDPDAGAFTPTGDMAYPNLWPSTATLLPDGRVLLTKYPSDWFANATEFYDPETGRFTAGPDMKRVRGPGSTSTLLPNGDALIAGRDFSWPFGGSAEVYDHKGATFGQVTPIQAEEGLKATLLLNGSVLLSGGWKCCGYSLDTAETYRPAERE